MISRKFVAFMSAVALSASGPALAQASAPTPAVEAVGLEGDSAMFGGEDGVGWVMGGLVLAAVAVVLILIYSDDDDDDDDVVAPVSP